MSNRPPSLGPLPEVHPNDTLERDSLAALKSRIPNARFILRREETDKGVDTSIEVIEDGFATNIRSQVQMKGTGDKARNPDGSYSFSADTSNINYLLNGTSPLYLVWFASSDEFRYAWLRDEARRLHRDNPEWLGQGSVTIYFEKVLTPATWGEIHERVLREGRADREKNDQLARATVASQVVLGFDPDTMAVTGPDHAYDLVRRFGIHVSTAGYAKAVAQWARLIPPRQAAEPAIQLALGYADYKSGDYNAARSHFGQAILGRDQLGQYDRYLLDSLVSECEYRLGRIGDEELHAAHERAAREAPAFLALQLRLDSVRRRFLLERDEVRREQLFEELHSLVSQIEGDVGASDAIRLYARLIRMFARGENAGVAFINAATRMSMRAGRGNNPATPTSVAAWHRAAADESAADKEGMQLLAEAEQLGHPLLIAEAIVASFALRVIRTVSLRFITAAMGQPLELIPQEVYQALRAALERGIRLYQVAGSYEGEVRVTLLLGTWCEACDRRDEVIALADRAALLARAMGYADDAVTAEELKAGNSQYQRLLAAAQNRPDADTGIAAMTDDDLRRFARHYVESAEIPADRLPVVEGTWAINREISRQRQHWCRHINLLESQVYGSKPSGLYLVAPLWVGDCAERGLRSLIQSRDGLAVLSNFQTGYCAGCSLRSPAI